MLRAKESLAHARQNWLMCPENKTSGVPGVLPIFEGMRARFTTTENAEAGACKHAWGTVTGWVLLPDDSKLVNEHRSEPELVLQHVCSSLMEQAAELDRVLVPTLDALVLRITMKNLEKI